jgi:hypothetical protein
MNDDHEPRRLRLRLRRDARRRNGKRNAHREKRVRAPLAVDLYGWAIASRPGASGSA